ncbi:hypothetical protein RJ641_021472 [Dillenia turbinata]|uniref:Uncharacterized protein n=1 Tax=Dillenia turbinata TaxID=194707 RepID=A0AAN8ULS5_9MAGN
MASITYSFVGDRLALVMGCMASHDSNSQYYEDEISCSLSAQIFELCDPDLFPETIQTSEVTSSSNCGQEDNSSYTTNLSFPSDLNNFNSLNDTNDNANVTTTAAAATTTSPITITNNISNLSALFDGQEDDISASIDFSPSPPFSVSQFAANQQGPFDFTSLQTTTSKATTNPSTSQVPIINPVGVEGLSQFPSRDNNVVPLMGPPLGIEDDCLLTMRSYVHLNPSSPSCSFLDHSLASYLPGSLNSALSSADTCGIFTGNLLMNPEIQPQDLDFQGDGGGLFCPEPLPLLFNPGSLQTLSNESQPLANGGGSSTPLASEITSLEDSTFKVGKLSVEQRKEKIHRYMKKRNERNFSKKIKNDDFGEAHRATSSTHEEDEDDEVIVKEEEEMVDSSDIFAHISGVNSFKCTYPIQSWI